MTTEERDAIIRRELDIYDQLDEIASALHKARTALGNLTDEVCQMRRNTETHDIRTETHECVKDTHDKTSPNNSEKPNNCKTEPQTDCGDFADRLAYERGVKHAWEVAQKVFGSTVTFYEAEDVAKQIDKLQTERSE